MTFVRILTVGIAATVLATTAFAGGHNGNPAVAARKAHMGLYQHNLGLLGAMAKGEAEYSADDAQAAANNLVALTQLSQVGYWTPGTDSGTLDDTRALPGLWADFPGVIAEAQKLNAAAVALAAVAGDGQAAIGPALGPVGATCGSCHKAYRKPRG